MPRKSLFLPVVQPFAHSKCRIRPLRSTVPRSFCTSYHLPCQIVLSVLSVATDMHSYQNRDSKNIVSFFIILHDTNGKVNQIPRRNHSVEINLCSSPNPVYICSALYQGFSDLAALRPLHNGNESRGHELYSKIPVISFTLWSKKWSKPLHRLQT